MCSEITGKVNFKFRFHYRKFTYEEESLFLLLFFFCLPQLLSSSCIKEIPSSSGWGSFTCKKMTTETESLADF